MHKRNILISGASIAGPALAFWLCRAGFSVMIVERAPQLRKGGYGVDVRGAAIEAIKHMGLFDNILAADTKMEGVFLVSGKNKLVQMNHAAPGSQAGRDIEIMRDDISSILYEHTKNDVEYLWGDSITTIEDQGDGVYVTFEHAQPRTFDLVVGADGIHSQTRQLLFGAEAQFTTFLNAYIAIFTTDNFLHLNHRHIASNALGKTVSMYSARNDTEAKAVFIFKSPLLHYDFHDIDAQKELLKQAFRKDSNWVIPQLLQAVDTAPDFYFDAISQIHLPQWYRGRVALVGDAAYGASPASGQGTSLALVGAYILAGELKICSGEYTNAFYNYQQKMSQFVKECQNLALTSLDDMIIDSRIKLTALNILLKFPSLLRTSLEQTSNAFNAKVAEAANSIKLESYGIIEVNEE